MEYLIIDAIKTAISNQLTDVYIGYYPLDYERIFNRLPSILIKLGNNVVSALGHHKYEVQVSSLFILYSNLLLEETLAIELDVIDIIIETLHTLSNSCITNITDTLILSGDINEYNVASATGYNANITVRKITQQFTFNLII